MIPPRSEPHARAARLLEIALINHPRPVDHEVDGVSVAEARREFLWEHARRLVNAERAGLELTDDEETSLRYEYRLVEEAQTT